MFCQSIAKSCTSWLTVQSLVDFQTVNGLTISQLYFVYLVERLLCGLTKETFLLVVSEPAFLTSVEYTLRKQ